MPLHLHKHHALPLRARGFSLIELLIVVAIIGILTAVALPSYQRQMLRGRRVDAKGAVLELAAREEKFFAMNNKFSDVASDLGYTSFPQGVISSGDSSYYQLTVSLSNNGQSYTATATPTGIQVQDFECYAYVIDQTGRKSNLDTFAAPINNNACW